MEVEPIVIAVVALVAIVAAALVADRIGVAAPLLLVVFGAGVSLLPFVPPIEVEPELILAGILPPLLYSAAVSMPSMDFRREFATIGGLSVLLVVISAVVLGLFFSWVIPGLDLWWGIALGAVVSPTDAVATSIVKRARVSPRVVSMLEGEGLLNDASALVILRTAIAGAAASVSALQVVGDFAFAVIVALVIGRVVGWLGLAIRSRVPDPTVNTAISFVVPFAASVPAELLGASGLVAAVSAGLFTGYRAARRLAPRHRLSDAQNWRTIEFVLEGAIFLLMGLQLFGILEEVERDHAGIGVALVAAAGGLVVVLLVRAGFIAPLIAIIARGTERSAQMQPRLQQFQSMLDDPDAAFQQLMASPPRGGRVGEKRRQRVSTPEGFARFATRVRRGLADVDYFLSAQLGWRDGAVIVWAGMRGAVTLAAAQTIPANAPQRSLLILVAFAIAVGSLLLQGATLRRFVALVKPSSGPTDDEIADDRAGILALLREAGAKVARPDDVPRREHTLAVIAAQRAALLDARDDGLFDSSTLEGALAQLDADEMSIELRGG